jgi:hypothetical protein
MNLLFWILFASETLFLFWALCDAATSISLPMPPYVPAGFLWLSLALVVKLAFKSSKIALILVGIPAIPLLIMLLFVIVVFIASLFGPIRWN